jgi:hypothetical protein
MALERELETYRKNLPGLLADKGKFVVIHGEEVLGVRATLEEALRLGYERFLNEEFLVREISETEQVLFSSRSIRPCPSSPDT